LLFAPAAQRQHTNERRPTSAREDPAQFYVSFADLTRWLLTTLS